MKKEDIEKVLKEQVRPILGEHGGSVEVVDVDEERGRVVLKMVSACASCPMAMQTMRNLIEPILRENFPDIQQVETV